MNGRYLAGVLGTLTVVASIAFGVYGLLEGYGITPDEAAPTTPSLVTLGIVVGVVLLLSIAGTTASRRLSTPYW